ncbi:acyl-CoA dehydrogenase [Aquisalimonas lutea]|nr:acyl-CoA dehydrogenase [Aquisalimonas lutea]MDN3516991.1 acyl-CoA dehydrogenase [Aquisalimonas lutea]
MTDYNAPTRDMKFVMQELLGIEPIARLPGFDEATPGLVDAVLEEAARFAGGVLAPLNQPGDRAGSQWHDGAVTTPDGFADAYRQYVDAGWNALPCPPDYDGQGLPEFVATATQEMWQSANMSFALCPLLTAGAIEALLSHGSEQQKATYLPKLVTGQWTGTMNLTEPQAGSDLAAVRCRAAPEGDHYRIQGQKIYITWGEHDCAENIVHLVLARTPDAPAGVKGISLFIVPKFLPDADGNPGERNDVRCVSIEDKIGIHASPTCTMSYGDNGGAVGYLVGEEGKGLAHMFTMMNEARHKVGVQGLAIAERAYQQARWYAGERVQGTPAGYSGSDKVSILHHPDVKRMMLTMRSQIEAMRALSYSASWSMDMSRRHPDADERARHQARVDLLIPIVKGWCTEVGQELTSIGIQVHGGMGYVEETGAAQHYRDARITTIYEGTTGIQANDLIGRKTHRDGGEAMQTLLTEMAGLAAELDASADSGVRAIREPLDTGIQALREAANSVVRTHGENPGATAAGAVPYLMMAGYVCGGALLARSALVARAALDQGSPEKEFYEAKLVTARFYAQHILPRAPALLPAVLAGDDAVGAMPAEWL